MQIKITLDSVSKTINQIEAQAQRADHERVPGLSQDRLHRYLCVMRVDDAIVAGAICELEWGYLYFDTVWTDERARGTGYGSAVMRAAHTYARQQGITRAYLFTTSFQARPFYEKLGYCLFGQVEDRPRGHTFYYMRHDNLNTHPSDPRISIEAPPSITHRQLLDQGLLSAIARTRPFIYQPLTLTLYDDAGKLQGGILAGIFWDWLDVRTLWLAPAARRWGQAMLQRLEVHARESACIGITADCTSFQMPDLFRAGGYQVVGELPERPPKHTTHFFYKRLR
ncbi:MAG: GNAT family N-acetyltransferase [Anaerolineae bacterium]